MTKNILTLLIVAVSMTTTLSTTAHANRSAKKIGIGVGLITEPAPSVLGYTLDYNLNDRFRITAGYGNISFTGTSSKLELTTIGADVKYFLLPWTFAPFISGGASSVTGTLSGTETVSGISISETGMVYSGGAGIDWQMGWGLTVGMEYKYLKTKTSSFSVPGFYFGFHF